MPGIKQQEAEKYASRALASAVDMLTLHVSTFLHNMDRLNHVGLLPNHIKTAEKVHKNTDKRNQGMSLYLFVVFVCVDQACFEETSQGIL